MKLLINGFEIEITENDSNLSVKVIDASGKELSNNTYSQDSNIEDNNTEINTVELPTVEETEESLIPTLESIKNLAH